MIDGLIEECHRLGFQLNNLFELDPPFRQKGLGWQCNLRKHDVPSPFAWCQARTPQDALRGALDNAVKEVEAIEARSAPVADVDPFA